MKIDPSYSYYHNLHQEYFNDLIDAKKLITELQRILPIQIEKPFSLPEEAIMIISNHPILEENSALNTKGIGSLKGFNYLGKNEVWFPSIRESLMQYALNIPLVTIIRPIGYDIATNEIGCLSVQNGNGVVEISNFLNRNKDLSCLIYPEAGFNKLDHCFRKGFYYIAKMRRYKYLLKLVVDPILGINSRNKIVFQELELIPDLDDNTYIEKWVDNTREWYKTITYNLYKEFKLI